MTKYSCIFIFSFWSIALYANLTLPSVFSDRMVLQQNSFVNFWGESAAGAVVKITPSWHVPDIYVKADDKGNWEAKVKTLQGGGPYTVQIASDKQHIILNDVLLGEVWLCSGQSNMAMPVKGLIAQPVSDALEIIIESEAYPLIRMFKAEHLLSEDKQFDVPGKWEKASIRTTGNFSAVGYCYAKELYNVLRVPIGIINVSRGASKIQAWMDKEILKIFPEIDFSNRIISPKYPQQKVSVLYNAMFYPLSSYSIKGIIWYQGENDVETPDLYMKLFPEMVKSWRDVIGAGNIPFYYVQIAPYQYSGSSNLEAAYLREVQAECLRLIPNSGMVATIDIGNEKIVHPEDKRTIGKRLSYLSLAQTYGYTDLPHTGPVLSSIEKRDSVIFLNFDHADYGLVINKSEEENGFEIAGNDCVFYPAELKIIDTYKNKIELYSKKVKYPELVRYCFKNYANGTLYNTFMLPASPFRTDTISISR